MMQSENINELAAALAKAQGEITPAIKDSLNPHFKSKYADLGSVWDACRTPLTKNGLAVIQTTEVIADKLTVITTLAHSSGQWMKSHLPVLSATNSPQAVGSALTYMRRYALSAITGVAPGDDDDAESAMTPGRMDPQIKVKEKLLVTKEQCQKLEDILTQCNPKYVEAVWSFLKKNGIHALADLPTDLYERFIKGALNNVQTQIVHE